MKIPSFTKVQAYSGLINAAAGKKIKHSINLLLAIAKWKIAIDYKTNSEYRFKVNFITLTLPAAQGHHSDKSIKKEVLDVWLKSAKRIFKLGSYVWRAERQQNGNLHFHLITDTFIPYDRLRDSWNKRLNRLGYIDEFEKKNGHRHPNSTDVHAVKKIKNLAAYVCKYMSKGQLTPQECIAQAPWASPRVLLKPKKNAPKFKRLMTIEDQRIDGKVWDCSSNLKSKARCTDYLEGDTLITWMQAKEQFRDSYKSTDNCSMVFFPPGQIHDILVGELKQKWLDYLEFIRNVPDQISTPKPKRNANKLQTLPSGLVHPDSASDYCPF